MQFPSIHGIESLTFDEILDLSKMITPIGYELVKKISPMPVNFWYRCRKDRNFHAHLSDKEHSAFNGLQSIFATFRLAIYFRYLVLEICDFKEKKVSNEVKERLNR